MARRIGARSRRALFLCMLATAACSGSTQNASTTAGASSGPVSNPAPSPEQFSTPPQGGGLVQPVQPAQPAPVQGPAAGPAASAAPAPASSAAAPAPSAAAPAPALRAPDAAPEILSVSLPGVVNSGETVSGSVVTSSNVASVEARVGGYSANAARTGVGSFALSYSVPRLPIFLRGRTYTLQIIARNTGGVATERDVPVTVR